MGGNPGAISRCIWTWAGVSPGGLRHYSYYVYYMLMHHFFLPFSRSIADYDGDTMSPPKNHFIHISVYFRFRLFCTETNRQSQTCTELDRFFRVLCRAVQHGTLLSLLWFYGPLSSSVQTIQIGLVLLMLENSFGARTTLEASLGLLGVSHANN